MALGVCAQSSPAEWILFRGSQLHEAVLGRRAPACSLGGSPGLPRTQERRQGPSLPPLLLSERGDGQDSPNSPFFCLFSLCLCTETTAFTHQVKALSWEIVPQTWLIEP